MANVSDSYQTHFEYFKMNGIDTSLPGFYDSKNFLVLERKNPALLNSYASFVSQKVFDDAYLTHAESVIRTCAAILNNELQKDGRKGACIDASMVLSRILEKEGIWNYAVKGSLTIDFPVNSGLLKKYFWSIDKGDYSAAHVWVVAPPFKIIDLTIKQQPYKENEESFLPGLILAKETQQVGLSLIDIIEPSLLRDIKALFKDDEYQIINYISRNLLEFTNYFKPELLYKDGVSFKYSPTGISASDSPLEDIKSLKLNGQYGIEIYDKFIKNKLH